MNSPSQPAPDLQTLVELFFDSAERLGQFDEVTPNEVPEPFRRLLAHDEHMTVTVESHHGCNVDVDVLETRLAAPHYSRKILLRRTTDRAVVQFGIVRLNFDLLEPDVRREIEAQQTPLGRILIEHNVLRSVKLSTLWRIRPAPPLRQAMKLGNAEGDIYGRTALIYCNGEPAVELLEIVTPD